jgi:translation initiation factor 1
MRRDVSNSRLVYSTDFGRACPDCGKPIAECGGTCRKQAKTPGEGVVRVRREVKGRKGKTVTTISGIPLDEDGLREWASELKRQCGAGGSVKDGVIVMQGDHCDVLVALIQKRGYTVKRAGG